MSSPQSQVWPQTFRSAGGESGTRFAITQCVGRLPGSQTRALWTLALFAAIQVADGALTAAGIAKFGPHVEGNPLIKMLAEGTGLGVALVVSKGLALFCATVLHLNARHLTLALLSLAYVMGAIVPWTYVLAR